MLGKVDSMSRTIGDANGQGSFIDNQNHLLNYKQASEYLGISVSKLKKMKAADAVPYVPIGDCVRFRIASLNRWIQRREVS